MGSKSIKLWAEHKLLKTYGIGADVSRADWQRYIRELVARGYLKLSEDGYSALQLTDKSDAVLKGLEKVELIASQHIEEKDDEALAFDNELLLLLRKKRQEIAVGENLPPDIVLSDPSLLEIATYLPQKMDELRQISGFSDIKLARYGRDFLTVINTYSAEKGLSSKMDQKTKSRTRKAKAKAKPKRTSDTYNDTLTLFKAGNSVAQIAAARKLSPTTIEGHLSTFVETGELDVKLFVVPEKMPAIQRAVEKLGSLKLAPIKEALGDNYSYGEIKAVIAWINYQQQNTES
jgi:ATP-dependent DNA helicase RecQ